MVRGECLRTWIRGVAVLADLALAVAVASAGPAGDACPTHLFVVARSKNANIVVYDANRGPAGDIAPSEPIIAYWLLNGEPGKREELNRVERERAYGVEAAGGGAPGTHAVVFKADRKRRLTLRVLQGCPVVTTPIGGRDGILRRIFIQSKDDSFPPKVEYVEFFGEDAATGEPLYEKFVPKK